MTRAAALAAAVLAACGHPSSPATEPASPPPPAPPDADPNLPTTLPYPHENQLPDPPPPPDGPPRPPGPQVDDVLEARITQLEQKLVIAPTGVPACDLYLHMLARLARCENLGTARESLIQALESTYASFAENFRSFPTSNPAERKSAVDAATSGCTAGVDALHQTATSMGCDL